MRRQTLPPPRPASPAGAGTGAPAPAAPPHRLQLEAPARARSIPRRLFDPVQGWFRRTERALSIFSSRHVFPAIPRIGDVYSVTLREHLTVAEAEVRIEGLSLAFDGLTVLFVSDLHAGPFLSTAAVEESFRRLASLAPDVVVLGGDLVTTGLEELLPHQGALSGLHGSLASFAVLGNHDHYTGRPDAVRAVLSGCGFRVLHNDAASIERHGSRLAFAGIDDYNAGRPQLDEALAAARRIGGPVLLASHNPDVFFEAARAGVALVLSGHTHGGQVRIPGRGVLVRMSRYRLDEGRYAWNGAEIVVSRGLGVSGLPLRLACPPEAALVTLRA
jgi:predicted MPP superfamily phosphohydrolase